MINWRAVAAVRKSVPLVVLLLTTFVFVFSFAKFETTLSLLLMGTRELGTQQGPFQFSWPQMLGMYALIGFTLALIQGGIVRPLANRVSEVRLALTGILIELGGFVLVTIAISQSSVPWLFAALVTVTAGFSFLQPSINALISRYADPREQGLVLGLGQSVNALGRILGSGLSVPMLKLSVMLPYVVDPALGLVVRGGSSCLLVEFPATVSVRPPRSLSAWGAV
jgi:fucose permease